MKILFLHQNFPGQFRHLAPALAAAGHEVQALAMHERPVPPGVQRHLYGVQRKPVAEQHPLVRDAEVKVLRGEACARAMQALAQRGFVPDLVIAHPGWGEALFVKDVFPQTRLVCFFEFFYRSDRGDVGFDPEFGLPGLPERQRIRTRNVAMTEALLQMDRGVAPTRWQASQLPTAFAPQVEVVFDGIDTEQVRPDPQARLAVPGTSLVLRAGDPVISFVNRNLEPYRGYHRFMRALPAVLQARPDAQVVIVGNDGVSYGSAPPGGGSWKQRLLDEVGAQLDLSRVHFVGTLPYASLLQLYQVTRAHVYLTYPFVLSWSCLEAMSAGAHVIGSRTPPVEEFIEDGVNGSLVDFFDTAALSEAMCRVLALPPQADVALRLAARETAVRRCDLKRLCLPRWRELLSEVCGQPV